jgi:hypothetical protein
MPPGAATVTRKKSDVTLTACDTGAAVPQPTHDGDEVLAYAAGRDSLYAGLLKGGAPSNVAACAATGIVQDPVFAPLLADPNQEPDAATVDQLRSRVQQIALDCARTRQT